MLFKVLQALGSSAQSRFACKCTLPHSLISSAVRFFNTTAAPPSRLLQRHSTWTAEEQAAIAAEGAAWAQAAPIPPSPASTATQPQATSPFDLDADLDYFAQDEARQMAAEESGKGFGGAPHSPHNSQQAAIEAEEQARQQALIEEQARQQALLHQQAAAQAQLQAEQERAQRELLAQQAAAGTLPQIPLGRTALPHDLPENLQLGYLTATGTSLNPGSQDHTGLNFNDPQVRVMWMAAMQRKAEEQARMLYETPQSGQKRANIAILESSQPDQMDTTTAAPAGTAAPTTPHTNSHSAASAIRAQNSLDSYAIESLVKPDDFVPRILRDLGSTAQDHEQYLSQPVNTVGDVLKLVQSYHYSIVEPSILECVLKLDARLKQLDSTVISTSQHLQWMAQESRQAQVEIARTQILVHGFGEHQDGDYRYAHILIFLKSVPECAAFAAWHYQKEERDLTDNDLCCVLKQAPVTIQYANKNYGSTTILDLQNFELRKAVASYFRSGGPKAGGARLRLTPATPRFQRRLEAPLRVLLGALNEHPEYCGKEITVLWDTLTLLAPQTQRAYDPKHEACAQIAFEKTSEAQGDLKCVIRITYAMHTHIYTEDGVKTKAKGDPTDSTYFSTAWEKQFQKSQYDMDATENFALTGDMAKAAEPSTVLPHVASHLRRGHWSMALTLPDLAFGDMPIHVNFERLPENKETILDYPRTSYDNKMRGFGLHSPTSTAATSTPEATGPGMHAQQQANAAAAASAMQQGATVVAAPIATLAAASTAPSHPAPPIPAPAQVPTFPAPPWQQPGAPFAPPGYAPTMPRAQEGLAGGSGHQGFPQAFPQAPASPPLQGPGAHLQAQAAPHAFPQHPRPPQSYDIRQQAQWGIGSASASSYPSQQPQPDAWSGWHGTGGWAGGGHG